MNTVTYEKQSSWQIIYRSELPMIRRAVEFLSREAGKLLIRKEGQYTLHVLPCRPEGATIEKNAMILGVYEDSPLIQSLLEQDEVPENGHCYKVMKHPEDEDARLVVMTAHTPEEVFFAAVDFIDRYPYTNAPEHYGLRLPDQIFDEVMGEASYAAKTKSPTRGIFTWGTPINDYRAYIENMARMKLNQLILWNDFVPFNAKEIIAYAHSFGIEVLWGYSWGWGCSGSQHLDNIGMDTLKEIQKAAVEEYEAQYHALGADGIYFQSFTERQGDRFGDILIADAVTMLVNATAGELLAKYPKLHIQFGLHASSVLDHLDSIAKVDSRVEIVWEDYGSFPSAYIPVTDEASFQKLLETTQKLIHLRGDAPLGLIVKGFMILDWLPERFVHQSGVYVMGDSSSKICAHDQRVRDMAWKMISADFMKYGEYMLRFVRFVTEQGGGRVNLCMAGTFDGGIHLPEAMTSSFFYDPTPEFNDTLVESARKDYVLLS